MQFKKIKWEKISKELCEKNVAELRIDDKNNDLILTLTFEESYPGFITVPANSFYFIKPFHIPCYEYYTYIDREYPEYGGIASINNPKIWPIVKFYALEKTMDNFIQQLEMIALLIEKK